MRLRRLTAAVAIAGALALAPSAAFAYGANDYSNKGTVSDTTPAAGTPFTVTVQGPANTGVTLTITSNPASIPSSAITIAGTKALTKTTNASGSVVFTVTLAQAGSFTLVATDAASGAVLSTQSVTVAGSTTASGLAMTGADPMPIALGAGALVLVGAGAVVFVARRRSAASR